MNGDSSDMDNKVLAGIVAVVVVVVVVAAAAIMLGGNDNEEGGVTIGVNYHGNGGTFDGASVYGNKDTTVESSLFTYEGHTFIGWNTAADGSGTSYAVGDPINYGSGTIDLYAQWAYTFNLKLSYSGFASASYYLVNSDGSYAQIGIGNHALPTDGRAGIAVRVNGVDSWTVENNSFVGTDSAGNTYRVSITMTGAEPQVVPDAENLAGWTFQFSEPVVCEISITEQQAH